MNKFNECEKIMDNKFKIVVTSYNNSKWVETNIESILEQQYQNYEVIYFDDASSDETLKEAKRLTKDSDKFTIIGNKKNLKKSKIFAEKIDDFIENDDIVVFIDGDDWLANSEVLTNLNNFYNQNQCWVTYGGMMVYSGGDSFTEPSPQNTIYSDEVHDNNNYRNDIWRSSHLKTMRGFIFKKIDKNDFKVDGNYITFADDLVMMYAAMEMSPKDKIKSVNFYSYIYNNSEEDRLIKENKEGLYQEQTIRSRIPYKTLVDKDIYITSKFSGAMGNQMFEIAAAYSLGIDTNIKVKASLRDGIYTLHQDWNDRIHRYLKTIFRKLEFTDEVFNGYDYEEPYFHYKEIDWDKSTNLRLHGHFQSQNYFKHNREDILDLFEPTEELNEYIEKKYGNLLQKDCVSIHIRRKEYKDTANNFHPLCSQEYYRQAINYFSDAEVFLVFSDETQWCKENLKNHKFVFVENENDVTDLHLMSKCKNNIIANSSFSWWSAWLNTNQNKKVIAPSPWFGKALNHNTGSLLPDEWIKMPLGDFNKEKREGVVWNI